MTTTYEQQLALVGRIERSASERNRRIFPCEPGSPVGIAQTPSGLIEIFLEGEPLDARHKRVRQALEYQTWYRADDSEMLANRILLPAAGHYEQVAAFLCTELLRNGATDNLAQAFQRTEPLIELAIADLLITDQTLVGLCGEMLLLDALLTSAVDDQVTKVVDAWKGHRDTARDFQLPWVGAEVKTTVGAASVHHFTGVHQLEIGHGVDGVEEEALYLVSIGIEWTMPEDDAGTTTLPATVDRVMTRITQALGEPAGEVTTELLDRIAAYGSATDLGYDHRTMNDRTRFQRPFRIRFARGYDLTDDAIRLLTTAHLDSRPFIVADSLSFRVKLPDQVRGDLNPVVGLFEVARRLLAVAGWAPRA